ncbi:MAG: hypothetical protein IJ383_06050 [Bacteroidales bacterium]|nr:hypothetical protein [Bacteroidales bacterium]
MRQVEFVPFKLTEFAEIFSIRLEGKETTELQEFLIAFKDVDNISLQKDFEQIIKSLAGIVQEGVKESFFRPEGGIGDRVCAIPLFSSNKSKMHGTLRLYCIRISNELLIVGGGGLKTTRSYEEDEKLHSHISILQSIDRELMNMEREGKNLPQEIYNLILYID